MGDDLKIVDSGVEARIYNGAGQITGRYEGGSFFAGLGRPWMGLHTIDTVRRDAADKEIWFETKLLPGGGKAEVILAHNQTKIIYTIEARMKIVEKIGEYKLKNGITILQSDRWADILKDRTELGKKLGLSEEFVTIILKAIHQESINKQTKIMNRE